MKSVFRFLSALIIFLSITEYSFGQGSIPLRKKSYLGALEFLPNSKLSEGYSKVKMSMPNDKDPLVDPQKWYVDGNNQMRGFVGDAVLFLEWWTTSYSPAERYKFNWTSSGYFELDYLDDSPLTPSKRINRSDLAKYPNLLKRFDNISPLEINFELTFHPSDLPDDEYEAFRRKYKIMESLGSAGYSLNYTRKLDGDFILYSLAGMKHDWVNPGPIPGGWDTFLNFPDKHEDKKSRLIEIFRMGRSLAISNFKITSIKWRMSDFVYIARKFEDYESGKDKPTAFDEVDKGEKKNKAGDGFWDETDMVDSKTESFYDEKTKSHGIKTLKGRILVPGTYEQIVKGDKYYIARNGNTAYLLNNMGIVLKTKSYPKIVSINQDLSVTTISAVENIERSFHEVIYGESDNLYPGKEGISKHYTIHNYRWRVLFVASNEKDNRTDAEKERDEINWEKAAKQKIREAESKFESLGYKKR